MLTPKSGYTYRIALTAVHVALAAVLLLMSLVVNGAIPGLSADAGAALGFVLFFGIGVPLLASAVVTFALSLFAADKWLGLLALCLLLAGALMETQVWANLGAALAYLALAIWALVNALPAPRS